MWLLVIILLVLCLGGLPQWGHGGFGYGYYPSSLLTILLVVVVLLLLTGRL